jgi:hypothetical protein
MKVLRAIGGFFVRIGRWIKETAWIQPLLIVGAIFAVIFAIPHIIDSVKGWFDESDAANKYFAKYQLSLKGANDGKSRVDDLFTSLSNGEGASYGEKFFIAFVEEDNSSCKDLYGGIKSFQDKFNKNAEFSNLDGKFKLYTIYTDTKDSDDDSIKLFDKVWSGHYSFFEDLAHSDYLSETFYAKNNDYNNDKYTNSFVGSSENETCPMTSPLMMYFDFTGSNPIDEKDQKIKGLSDVIFSVDGSTELDKARTLKNCWAHSDVFGQIKEH